MSTDEVAAFEMLERVAFQYAVKFVCGQSKGSVVAPGVYWTAINVHNPNINIRGVQFRKTFVIALPGEKPGPVSPSFPASLGPNEALEIDWPDIREHLHYDGDDLLKGFVVIDSGVELDVVAVYTALGPGEQAVTIHTERVPARKRF